MPQRPRRLLAPLNSAPPSLRLSTSPCTPLRGSSAFWTRRSRRRLRTGACEAASACPGVCILLRDTVALARASHAGAGVSCVVAGRAAASRLLADGDSCDTCCWYVRGTFVDRWSVHSHAPDDVGPYLGTVFCVRYENARRSPSLSSLWTHTHRTLHRSGLWSARPREPDRGTRADRTSSSTFWIDAPRSSLTRPQTGRRTARSHA